MSRVWKKSCDIENRSHAELDEQMKKLERTLKYYIQSRQSEQHAKTKLTGVSSQKQDLKIERRLSKVCLSKWALEPSSDQLKPHRIKIQE